MLLSFVALKRWRSILDLNPTLFLVLYLGVYDFKHDVNVLVTVPVAVSFETNISFVEQGYLLVKLSTYKTLYNVYNPTLIPLAKHDN